MRIDVYLNLFSISYKIIELIFITNLVKNVIFYITIKTFNINMLCLYICNGKVLY